MDDKIAVFIDKMGFFGQENGIPRSVARVMGYLLVCQPAVQSAADIRTNLSLSAGAVSNALVLLQKVGLVRRVAAQRTRLHHYVIDDDGWQRAIEQRLQSIPRTISLAEEGLRITPGNTRLQAMRNVYVMFEQELARLLIALHDRPR